jgi:hypothetical protein
MLGKIARCRRSGYQGDGSHPHRQPVVPKTRKEQNSRHFVSHLGNFGRRLTSTLQLERDGKAGCREASCRSHSS